MLKFALPPTPNLKFALPPIPTPDASQWNIGGVRAGVGHVHFRLFVSISFAFGSQRKHSFQWNMGLSLMSHVEFKKCPFGRVGFRGQGP